MAEAAIAAAAAAPPEVVVGCVLRHACGTRMLLLENGPPAADMRCWLRLSGLWGADGAA
jgi:hypothetical protein